MSAQGDDRAAAIDEVTANVLEILALSERLADADDAAKNSLTDSVAADASAADVEAQAQDVVAQVEEEARAARASEGRIAELRARAAQLRAALG